MRAMNFLLAAAVVAVASQVWAAEMSPKVGDEAPTSVGVGGWVANAPETDDLQALRGSVVMIKIWGVR